MKIYKWLIIKNSTINASYRLDGEMYHAPSKDVAMAILEAVCKDMGEVYMRQYDIMRLGFAYEYHGGVEQWLNDVKEGEVV